MNELSLIKNKYEFEDVLKNLKSNPLFYLFGENKENFHSSFWYWMFQVNKAETIKILTGERFDDNEASKAEFYREKEISSKGKKETTSARCDVVIELGDKRFIIETKVKSFPTKQQLDRIWEAAEKSSNKKTKSIYKTKLICIHLYPDNVISDVINNVKAIGEYKWYFLNLSKLQEYIVISEYDKKNKKYYSYLEDYKDLLKNLGSLFAEFQFDNDTPEYDFTIENAKNQPGKYNLYKELDQLKLWELFLHFRSKHFINAIYKKLLKNYVGEQDKIKVEASIHNKKGTISFGYIVKGDFGFANDIITIDNKISKIGDLVAGVQLEGEQFRRFVISSEPLSIIKDYVNDDLFQGNSREGDDSCKYGKHFRYRYKKIDKKKDFESSYDFIDKTFKMIKKINNL